MSRPRTTALTVLVVALALGLGSSAVLAPEADAPTVIGMMQTLGRTWHVVTKLISGSSRYESRTRSSTAAVRGTIFAVDVHVDADGPAATVTTSEGVVVHSAAGPAGAASAV